MQLKNLLCPLDFSPASLRAFDYSIKLAKNYDACLYLLHVIAPLIPSAYDISLDMGTLIGRIKEQVEPEMRRLKKVAADAGVQTQADIQMGDVGTGISEAARIHAIDVVVMGKHGRRRLDRWFMGSVTERLLRHLPVPILIIEEGKAKRATPPNIKRIVVTTDFSEGAEDAISYALSLAQDAQATVTFLHVMPHKIPGVGVPYEKPVNEVRSDLERLVPKESRMSGRVATKVTSGVPYEQILSFLEKTRPDLLVMNIHGKDALERALLGSTAERVIRGAPCSVLAIPPRKVRGRQKAFRPTG